MTEPIVGDLWKLGDVTIRVNKIEDGEVWLTWHRGEDWAYKRFSLDVWDRDIASAQRAGRRDQAGFLEFPVLRGEKAQPQS